MPKNFPPEICILQNVNAHYGAKDEEQMLNYFGYIMPITWQQNIECNCGKKEETRD